MMAAQTAYAKSSSEGWVRVTVLESSEFIAQMPGAVITRGAIEKYRVKIEEGKHKGAVVWMPANYVQLRE